MSDLGISGISDVTPIGDSAAFATYRVRDDATGQTVFLKIVHAAGRPQSAIDRFFQEQDVLAELATHPNLVSVFGHSTTASGEPYIVTEATPARNLADRAVQAPPMTGPEVLRVGIRAAGALESAHRGGVAHGDLRGSNIVLLDSGEPSVADVGLVTLTGVAAAAATDPRDLEHVAPELLDGQYPSPATDQYALAATLYHLLAGEPAFVRPGETTVVPVIKRIATEPAPPLAGKGVPGPVADVVHKALSRNPAERYPNMQAFARALQQAEVALGLPVTDLTVMTPATQLPTAWSTAPAPPAVAAAAAAAAGPAAGGPPAGGPPGGPPPAAAGGTSRTPLFIGIGVAVVIALLAVFLLTRGGDDKKKVVASSSSSSSSSRSRSSSSSDTSSDTDSFDTESTDSGASALAPDGFTTVFESFDVGEVSFFAPTDWTDVVPIKLDNGEPRLQVAPSVDAFLDGTFTAPGIQIDAFGAAANGIDNPDPDALVEQFIHQPPEGDGVPGGPPVEACTSQGRVDFPAAFNGTSDGGFVGRAEKFVNCRNAGALIVMFAVPPDKSFILQVFIQVTTPDEEADVPTLLGSIIVTGVQ